MGIQNIKIEVSQLPRNEQAELMHFLIDLMSNDAFLISEGWEKELNNREESLENGTSVGQPAREVLAKYYKK
ncbi:MAG: addiction module protein [Saprospiraceae bacterium]